MTLRVPGEEAREKFAGILAHAFANDTTGPWLERAGSQNIRVFEHGGAVVGGLVTIPMGQYFGGRSVPSWGVAGVAIAPETRGRGVASQMMLAMLREARDRGAALSTLFPATMTLYRRVGYERSGAHYAMKMDPKAVAFPRVRDLEVSEVAGMPDELRALYAETIVDGAMDRGPYLWTRIEAPVGLATKTYAFRRGGKLEGYVVVAHARVQGLDTKVTVTDLGATTTEAAQAIFAFLGEYRSLAFEVTWKGDPSDVFSAVYPERWLDVTLVEYPMVRIVDVVRAFTMRGWPEGARGTLAFELRDGSMPENSGRYAVTLEGGKAHVACESGKTDVSLDEHALVSLYTGMLSPRLLAQTGRIASEAGAMASAVTRLESWFAGRSPVTRDFF